MVLASLIACTFMNTRIQGRDFHPDWKSSIFNYGRHEVRSFLISSAFFWLDHFHLDGLSAGRSRFNALLDYSRMKGVDSQPIWRE